MRSKPRAFKWVVLFAILCSLAACGFHLRGPVELPDSISPLFIDMRSLDNELGRELRTLLSQSGENNLTETRDAAMAVLELLKVRQKQRVVSVDDRGRAREYELSYIVRYRVNRLSGESSGQPAGIEATEVRLKRDLLFDPDSVLAVGYESETLYSAMRKDMARIILQQVKSRASTPVTP